MIEKAGFIPQLAEDNITYDSLNFTQNGVELSVQVPVLTATQLTQVIEKVTTARNSLLQNFTVIELVDIIDNAVHQLLDSNNRYRKKAEQLLPIITGFDAQMIRLGLTASLKTFRKPQLLKFLVEDFNNPLLLDGFQPRAKGGYVKAVGPQLMTHIWAGNVPGLPLWSLLSGLLVKGGTIGKVSSSEPLFAGWVAQLITEIEPKLKDCLAILWWRGGDEVKEKQLFNASDIVLAYGGNTALSAMQSRVPVTSRFLAYGHKIAFGLIANTSLNANNAKQTAHNAAFDVINYDQQACFSPHCFFIEKGGQVDAKDFSELLAGELANYQKKYPRQTLSFAEQTQLVAWQQQEQMSTYQQTDKQVISPESGDWSVVYETAATAFVPSPLNRTVRVIEVADLTCIPALIAPYRAYLQTVGIAAAPTELFKLSAMVAELGVTRITAIGNMTAPEAGWHHDGSANLLDLVRMVDLELSAEQAAEHYSSYRH
ncbi:acyl-CoA reductase [Oceanisphaera pacifica]|uniref:Acyl-CoA reductase n=1 Tax=Oceanisphaera pacifica TaxID=2818389 RepID=A0ABS3NIG0_9GAMM|nr:acyl-CoA reductase [Oceanisphaera pacifica]MBO1520374.1 hypothetical protein [Oceanisphaera pacifica]